MNQPGWLVMPQQVHRQVAAWQADPRAHTHLSVRHVTQYSGELVYALTVTEPAPPRQAKRAVWLCVPHAHEPAGTAALMNVLHQLLTGQDLHGQPCTHDRQRILRHVLVTCNPDA